VGPAVRRTVLDQLHADRGLPHDRRLRESGGHPVHPAGQIRYAHPVSPNLTVSVSLKNSEFNGRTEDAVSSESTTAGIRAGLDRVPDFTLAATLRED
jgi:hypothetical protein